MMGNKEPAQGYEWNREGHPYAIPQEQDQVKSKDRSQEWGHHAPNRGVMETSSKGRARTSHLAGRCRVEEEAPVEQGAEVGD